MLSGLPGASFERRTGHARLLLPSVPIPVFNGVLVESEPVSGIAGSIEEVETRGLRCGVQLRPEHHPAAEAEASRLGLTARVTMPGMAVTAEGLVGATVGGLAIARVENEAGLADAAHVAAAGFETPLEIMRALYVPELLGLRGMAVYVGRVGGEPVTTAIGYRTGDELGIFSVATSPGHRRRGYGAAITARTARSGLESGAEMAWLQTSAMGEPVYRALGFRHVASHTMLTRPGPHD